MNKIFTARQIKECDAYTIQKQGIASVELMERAANKCFEWIAENYKPHTPFLVICGMGNNGGDGLALTRILLQEGYSAMATVLKTGDEFSEDASHNFKLLHQLSSQNVQILNEGKFISDIPHSIVIIDAIFGTGLSRPVSGWVAAFINELNNLPNQKIAIDTPSGLPPDNIPAKNDVLVKANDTLSFQFYKRSFLHQEAADFIGNVHLLDIGLSEQYMNDTHSQYRIITPATIQHIYRPRKKFTHKGNYGKAMLVGGSYGKIGAIALSTQAALRAGAGLVYVQSPECGNIILQTLAPEAMYIGSGETFISRILEQENTTVGIGPGLGMNEQTQIALFNFLEKAEKPLVLDADALNLVAKDAEMLTLLPPHSIFTPHPKEFERLFGKSPDSMMQVEWARGIAMKHNIFIVLKRHHTPVLMPDGECWYNITGNAGMATGGSGDVLTGIIASLLAQGYTSKEAAMMGVYLHGRSGDIAAETVSSEALTAGDIVKYLGQAFKEIS